MPHRSINLAPPAASTASQQLGRNLEPDANPTSTVTTFSEAIDSVAQPMQTPTVAPATTISTIRKS